MPLYPFLPQPVMLDPTSTESAGFIGGYSGGSGFAGPSTPIFYNGALYQLLVGDGPFESVQPIYVYKSLDKGASWARVGNSTVPTTRMSGTGPAYCFDGAHSIVLANSATATSGDQGPLHLKNFDLDSETWGADYGTAGAPNVWPVLNACFVRPDGSILVIATFELTGGVFIQLYGYVYSAGTWGAGFRIDANIPAPLQTGLCASCMDSTGRVHVFFDGIDPSFVADAQWCYQAVGSDNSLGTFATVFSLSPTNSPFQHAKQPCISGDNVILGLVGPDSDLYVTVAVGSPLSAAAFSLLPSPGVDPIAPLSADAVPFGVVLAADASGVYLSYIYNTNNFANQVMRLCFTPNVDAPLTGWGAAIEAFNSETQTVGEVNDWEFLYLSRQAGNTFAGAATGPVPAGGQPTMFWLGGFAPAPPSFLGGSSSFRFKCCNLGHSDQKMLAAEILRKKRKRKTQWPYLHEFAPPHSLVVNEGRTVDIPAPSSSVTVLSYRVPVGLRLYLEAVLFDRSALIFNPTDVAWTLFQNGAPVNGLTGIVFPLGSYEFGEWWEFERAYEFDENSLLEVVGLNLNLQPGPPNQFVVALGGYLGAKR